MPCTSAVRASGSTAMTPVRPEVSRPGTVLAARGAEQVGGALGQPHPLPRRDGAVAGEQPLDAGLVGRPDDCGHAGSTLSPTRMLPGSPTAA